jgi:hypothetical protein
MVEGSNGERRAVLEDAAPLADVRPVVLGRARADAAAQHHDARLRLRHLHFQALSGR